MATDQLPEEGDKQSLARPGTWKGPTKNLRGTGAVIQGSMVTTRKGVEHSKEPPQRPSGSS